MAWVRQLESGNWQACWRNPAGEVRTKTFGPKAKTAARKYAQGQEADVERGTYRDPGVGRETLEDLWRDYRAKADDGKVRLSPSARVTWECVWRRYVGPVLGRRSIATLRRSDIRDLIEGISSKGQAGHSLKLVRMLLNRAVDDERIAANPAARLGLGDPEPSQWRSPRRRRSTTSPRPSRRGTGRWTTCRRSAACGFSEVTALRLEDVDWLRRRVMVDERLVEAGGKIFFGEPKTAKSTGWVELPEWVIAELAEHVRLRVPSDDPKALLFTGTEGKPIRRRHFVGRVWKPALERAKVDRPLHVMNLRHTGASLIHEAGFSARDVATMLRHSSTEMAARYVRVYADRNRRIADAVGRLGRPAANQQQNWNRNALNQTEPCYCCGSVDLRL